jgi:hypothetical protein
MSASRGRVIKAGRVAASPAPIAWEPRSPVEDTPPAEVEVVREGGVVAAIKLRCRCGREHELELLPAAARPESGGPS